MNPFPSAPTSAPRANDARMIAVTTASTIRAIRFLQMLDRPYIPPTPASFEVQRSASSVQSSTFKFASQLSSVKTPPTLPKRMDAIFLDKLNPQQRAAATAPLETPLLIIAGAGTG